MIGFLIGAALVVIGVASCAYQLWAWKTTYENHAWWRNTHRLTGEHRWVKKPYTAHSPLPWLDDEGREKPLRPPARPVR